MIMVKIYEAIYKLTCIAYGMFRGILLAAVDDPDKDWDDFLMGIMDRLFNYKAE